MQKRRKHKGATITQVGLCGRSNVCSHKKPCVNDGQWFLTTTYKFADRTETYCTDHLPKSAIMFVGDMTELLRYGRGYF